MSTFQPGDARQSNTEAPAGQAEVAHAAAAQKWSLELCNIRDNMPDSKSNSKDTPLGKMVDHMPSSKPPSNDTPFGKIVDHMPKFDDIYSKCVEKHK